MVRAFFRGFVAASNDERAIDDVRKNPYGSKSPRRRFWSYGVGTGARAAS